MDCFVFFLLPLPFSITNCTFSSLVLKEAMDVMDKWYKHEITYATWATMGTATMRYAFDNAPPEARNNSHILKEHNLASLPEPLKNVTAYRDFPRQDGFGKISNHETNAASLALPCLLLSVVVDCCRLSEQ